jgi:uncharacterized protein
VLEETIRTDLNQALKNHETQKVGTLRFLLSAVKNVQIERRQPLSDGDVLSVIQKQIKSRNDSIDLFDKGGRADLAKQEQQEISILETYLPVQLNEEEITALVKKAIEQVGATDRKDMGKVMGALQAEITGKADKGKVAQIAGQLLDNHGQ